MSHLNANVVVETQILPLALTRYNDHQVCVAGIDSQGLWRRPVPVTDSDLNGSQPLFAYRQLTMCRFTNSGPRPEDCALLDPPLPVSTLTPEESWPILAASVDKSPHVGFQGGRTACLIEAEISNIYFKRHLRGNVLIHLLFEDAYGEEYDWIVPEISLVDSITPFLHGTELEQSLALNLRAALLGKGILALGLTLPNNRFPGRFGGCHPLVVGIHTFPDWHRRLGGLP